MLQVARLAPRLLGESSGLVAGFLQRRLHPSGGFVDRAGEPDLYYTVFGLEGLLALRLDVPAAQTARRLEGFGDGAGLDFVHLTCLARCWAALPRELRERCPTAALADRMEQFRTPDGAYDASPEADQGSLYGCFLALGGYQDIGLPLPDPGPVIRCVESLRAEDGGYANQHDMPVGLTPPTAAAVTLLRQLEQPVPAGVGEWLLERCHPDGGFYAAPLAPMPDLLSTAAALHALAGMQADLEPLREPCLDFLDTLWVNEGGFHGNWSDDDLDCEYTYYGLLALGHLAV